jgi:hypothetical protein
MGAWKGDEVKWWEVSSLNVLNSKENDISQAESRRSSPYHEGILNHIK